MNITKKKTHNNTPISNQIKMGENRNMRIKSAFMCFYVVLAFVASSVSDCGLNIAHSFDEKNSWI